MDFSWYVLTCLFVDAALAGDPPSWAGNSCNLRTEVASSRLYFLLTNRFLCFPNLGCQFLQVLHDDFVFANLTMLLAAEIITKLDQLLLAVNKKVVEPVVETAIVSKSTRTEHHVLEGVDASPIDDSSIKPAKDVLPGEEWTDIGKHRG